LSSAQVPPHVRIGHAARRHGEKTQSQDGNKDATRLEELIHVYQRYTAILKYEWPHFLRDEDLVAMLDQQDVLVPGTRL
jgi:hypothetical protein